MFKQTILKNGLRVVTHNIKERSSISMGICMDVGGRYEEKEVCGAAHFLEHIVFKGSRNYSCGEIKEKIEGVGGSLNAFTTEEATCYYAKIPTKHAARAFDILADMVFSPKIPKREVEKERTVILEEIKMYDDLPQYYVLHLLDQLLWPQHPLGENLTGTSASVSGMTKAALKNFHARHYTSGNAVIAACGEVKHEEFVRLVRRKLEKIPAGAGTGFLPAPGLEDKPKVSLFYKQTEQMHLALGMPALSHHHPDRYVEKILHIILGGNMSSRLFNEVREKRGLAYSIGSTVKTLRDTGAFMVRAGVDNRKIVDAAELILKELGRIRRGGVQSEELNRAKEYFIGQIQLALEDTMDYMLWIGEATLSDDECKTVEEIVKSIKKVTPADVKRVAGDILRPERFHLAVVGPLDDRQKKSLSGLLFGG